MVECKVCQKKCKTNSQLVNHFKIHENEQSFNEIRRLYLTEDFSCRDLSRAGYKKRDISRALKGFFRNKSEALVIANKKYPTKSVDAKRRMSESKKRYYAKHPEKLPYRLRHSSNESYVEVAFANALKRHNIKGWVSRYQIGLYEYDFAFLAERVDVEIDGKTHTIESVKIKDDRRDEWSKKNGWYVIRFTANDIKTKIDDCIDKLKKILKNRPKLKFAITPR